MRPAVRSLLCWIGVLLFTLPSWGSMWDRQPPTVELWIYPSATIPQGRTAAVWLSSSEPLKEVRAWTQPDSIIFYLQDAELSLYRALLGIKPSAPCGTCTLHITVADSFDNATIAHVLLTVLPTDFTKERLTFAAPKEKYLRYEPLERDIAKITEAIKHNDDNQMWELPFLLPVEGHVSSPYGAIRLYQNGMRRSQHLGVDLAAPEGTPVMAPAGGTVVLSEELEVHGNTIIIDHGQRIFSILAHLNKRFVTFADTVTVGELVGSVGSTGLATGPHLHWGLSVGNVRVEPLQWIDTTLSYGIEPHFLTGDQR